MTQPTPIRKSLRSATFVPGYMRKFLDKAIAFPSDALILDLEDSVPEPFKEDARKYIREYLEAGSFRQQIFIRVNDIDSGLLSRDLAATLHGNTDGFMFTKVRDERDIIYFDKLLTQLEHDNGFENGKFKFFPLIEMGSAILRAHQIATASPRMIGLAFGGEDYLTDLDGLHKEHGTSLLVPRSLIVIAARSAHIDVLDTPYLDIRNTDGFRREVELARELGFSGQLLLHPTQIEIANEVFSPSEEEIAEARRIIDAIRESSEQGQGVTLLDGKLIGPPMRKRAHNVLAKAERIMVSKSST
jgi:citrate lyase subunit beta / citryl-CoA lyase